MTQTLGNNWHTSLTIVTGCCATFKMCNPDFSGDLQLALQTDGMCMLTLALPLDFRGRMQLARDISLLPETQNTESISTGPSCLLWGCAGEWPALMHVIRRIYKHLQCLCTATVCIN